MAMALQELLEIGPYSALYLPAKGPDLAISFASIGHDASRAPSPEFIATASARGTGSSGRAALFIQDRSRSWANDPHFEAILHEALARIPLAENMVALGMSMGGFSALVAAQFLPLQAVLAFVPQYSIDPAVVAETRWQEWRPTPPLRWPHCPLPQGDCHATLLHAGQDDGAHIAAFAPYRGGDHILFDSLAHSDLVPHLKSRGLLAGLLQAAFQKDRRRLLRIISSAGGKRIKTP